MSPEFIGLLGGSALLVYSIEELSKSVQYLAGSKFRVWINHFTENRLSGMLLGIVLSLLLCSSGAVTVMLVGLASSRLLSLEQVFSVTLGAAIGSTFIVYLFAVQISQYGLLLIAVGVAMTSLSRSDRVDYTGKGLFFLGLLFFSMKVVEDAGIGLEKNELFLYLVNYFRNRPIVSLLMSAAFTACIRSSAATIAFVMSLTVARGGNVMEALPWVLGANIGTTTTAYIAALRSGALGKQAALGHLLSKLVGVVICLPLMRYLGSAAQYLSSDVGRQIADTNTLFNCLVAAVFFPFIPLGVRLVKKWVPERESQGPFTFQYLDPRSLEAPELALAQAQREILRLADAVEQMVERCLPLFIRPNAREFETLKGMDQVVDFLNKGIKLFLTRLSQKEMTPEQVQKEFELLLRTNDLENIGDIVDKNILELVRKNTKKGYVFSKEGWNEITTYHGKVVECLRLSTTYFNSRDRVLQAKVTVALDQIEDLMIELTEQHVQRLHEGVKETLDTTSIHLDLLGNLQRIAGLAGNFLRVQGFKGETQEISRILNTSE